MIRKTWSRNIKIHADITLTLRILIILVLLSFAFGIIANAQTGELPGKLERVISFSGYHWVVKSSVNTITGTMGPGNNYFSDSKKNVWVDKNGWLHLKITLRKNKWYCAEVTLTKPLGYKKYAFSILSQINQYHPNVVGGLFTYLDGTDNAEEIDIEFSKWGNEKKVNTQYSVQPSEINENTQNFDLNGNASTHVFNWQPGSVDFVSYLGNDSSLPTDSALIIKKWKYSGKDVPVNLNGKVHINLWIFRGVKIDPADNLETEMIVKSFQAL
ncbi:MAG TPA: hypothetical protein VGK38_15415 [Prolixibacteraceae bacterium]|jgi:hypothetical protein